jgi:O-antigen ligase
MPRWFFWVVTIAIGLALLLPYAPVKYALFALFGAIFISFYSSAPERTLFLFLLGMPIVDLIPPGIIPIPGINAETILILALAGAASASKARQPLPHPSNPFALPIAYYAIVLSASAMRSWLNGVDYGSELFSFVKNQLFFVFLAPIAFRLIWNERQLRAALHLIAVTCFLVSIQALWTVRDTVLRGYMLERNRAAGLVAGQPNLFGGFLAMMILLFVSLLLSKHVSKTERLGYLITVIALAGALLMTLSRGSWLALLLALGVLSLLRGARAIAFVLAVALSAPWWLPVKVVERAQHTFEGKHSTDDQELEDSAQVRVDQWKALPEIMKTAPLFGHGFRTFANMWARYSIDHEPKAAHSTWVEFLAEEGIVGIVAYLWLLTLMGWVGFTAWRVRDGGLASDLALGFMCAILCLMVLDSSGTRFRNREVMAYMWVSGGALARFVAAQRASRTQWAGEPAGLPTPPSAA